MRPSSDEKPAPAVRMPGLPSTTSKVRSTLSGSFGLCRSSWMSSMNPRFMIFSWLLRILEAEKAWPSLITISRLMT